MLMRVAMYYNNRDVRLEEMPRPKTGKGELLVKVVASGICGSDVMEWYRIKRAPLVLGHEIAGDIVEVGDGVDRFREGDRVFVSHHVPCMECRYCLSGHQSTCDMLRKTNFYPGGFSEFVRVPAVNLEHGVSVLPEEISYEDGSLIEPLACVVRGFRLMRFSPNRTILVLGSGIAGLLNIKLARTMGAERIIATDVSTYRLEAARRFGADVAIHAEEDVPVKVREANDGRGADYVVVSTGAQGALEQAFRCVDRGATLLMFAPPLPGTKVCLPLGDMWKDEVTVTSTYAGSPEDIADTIDLLRTGRVTVRDV
ncbi:MAG: alcohol dehydrogenase catalytic domain-containing protein, partial [Methanobacteriota archaeon]